MGMVSALTPALRKEATLLAEKLGISVEEAVAKYFSKTEQKLIPGQRLLPGNQLGQKTLPPAKAKARLSDSVGEAYPPLDKSSSKEFPGGLTDRIRNSEQGFRVSEPDVAADKSLDVIRPDRPTYQERGLVPVGKPGELAPIEPIKTGTGFTFKDSPNMDAETVPTQLLLGPGKKSMSLRDKLALGAAAGVGATAVGATGYLTPQRSNEVRDVPLSEREKNLRAFKSSFNQFTPLESDRPKSQTPSPVSTQTATKEPVRPADQRLFDPANFAKAPEGAATTTTSGTTPPAIVPPPAKNDEPVMESQARRNYNKLSTELLGYEAKKLPEDFTQNARADLKKAYEDKVSRNDWAEVATNLVNAIATYGSAKQAGDRYSGKINLSPGVDYNAKSDRAAREYSSDISEQDKIVASKQREIDTSNADTDRKLTLQERLSRGAADLEGDANKLREAKATATQAAVGKMTDRETLAAKEAEEERKANRVLNAADQETIDKITKYENLETQISKTDPKNTKLLNALIQLQTKLSGALTPDQEAAAVTKAHAGDKPSWIPFMGTEASTADEEKAKREARSGVLRDYQSRIAGRNALPSTPPAPSTGKTDQQSVTVRHKSTGQTRQFPAGSVELQNALQNPEFEVVR